MGGALSTASVIIIGDEILTGKFADENGPFFIRRLRELGVDLRRLVSIRDGVQLIADEVRRCAAATDLVFTTGGVGPTHDDMTYEGVAAAFGVGLDVHPGLLARMTDYGIAATPMNLRMATLPAGAELIDLDDRWPVVRMRNVHIFPGVPALLRGSFDALAPSLSGRPVVTARIYADDWESSVADRLAQIAGRYPDVAIGSYPRYHEDSGRLIVTFEGHDEARVAGAAGEVAEGLQVRKWVGAGGSP